MRKNLFHSLFFALLILTSCQNEQKISSPAPTPEKRAEFKREVFDVEKYPGLLAVGRLQIDKSWCAITLVSENIGVTAAHCFKSDNIDILTKDKVLLRSAKVIFMTKDSESKVTVKIDSVLKWKMNPDFAIVKLKEKMPNDKVEPLELSDMEFTDMLSDANKLGCAGYNGDKELGNLGKNLTISRNIKVLYEESNSKKIDTNCVSTFGGSGGLFFEEELNSETNSKEYKFLGVIWGVVGDNYDANGNLIADRDTVTSITPVKVFREELVKIIENNQ